MKNKPQPTLLQNNECQKRFFTPPAGVNPPHTTFGYAAFDGRIMGVLLVTSFVE
jgi:hypothetical protein